MLLGPQEEEIQKLLVWPLLKAAWTKSGMKLDGDDAGWLSQYQQEALFLIGKLTAPGNLESLNTRLLQSCAPNLLMHMNVPSPGDGRKIR